jgi:hypothetical protein
MVRGEVLWVCGWEQPPGVGLLGCLGRWLFDQFAGFLWVP